MRKVNFFEKKRINLRRNLQRMMDKHIIEEREKEAKEAKSQEAKDKETKNAI